MIYTTTFTKKIDLSHFSVQQIGGALAMKLVMILEKAVHRN